MSLPWHCSLCIFARYTLNVHVFAAQRDPLWLMGLEALRADVDLLPQHPTLLHHEHFFHEGNNCRAILLTDWHGTIPPPLHRHARDGDCVLKQWFINKGLAFVDHFGHADFACLDQPLLHLQLFHQYRHHHGRVLVRTGLATRGRQVSQTQRELIAPIRLLDQHVGRYQELQTARGLHHHLRRVAGQVRCCWHHRPPDTIFVFHLPCARSLHTRIPSLLLAVLLRSDSVHGCPCNCARCQGAASDLSAPVIPPTRPSPISLFGRARCVFRPSSSAALGSSSGQTSAWSSGAETDSTPADPYPRRSRIVSLS